MEVTDKQCYLGDGDVMQVRCLLNFVGTKADIDRLQNILPQL